jgi:HYR domain
MRRNRIAAAAAVALFGSVGWTALGYAQGVPGVNTNVIGPTPIGSGHYAFNEYVPDRGLKQQNEPACGSDSINPKYIFCTYNDYRGTEYPQIGDSSIGVSMSRDGGLSWLSRLSPGFPSDPVPPGPIGAQFAADPGVVIVPGLALVSFIAACRKDACPGGLYLQRWYLHNRENGFPWDPLDRSEIKTGSGGRFLDKPGIAGALANPGSAPDVVVNIPTSMAGVTAPIKVPAGRLHMAYSVFTGNDNNLGTQIWHIDSDTWGATWNKPQKISESVEINQGAAIATKNDGLDVAVVWRRFSDNNESNALMYAYSKDGGKTFSPALVLTTVCAFDQPGGPAQFRTNALPAIASDDQRFYVFFAARATGLSSCRNADGTPAATDFSRIVYLTSDLATKKKQDPVWTTPKLVDPLLLADGSRYPAHQFMPAAAGAGGIVQVAFYDNRFDKAGGTGYYLNDYIQDGHTIRHTLDVIGVQMKNGAVIAGSAAKVSKYPFGIYPYFEDDAENAGKLQQLEFNYPNARLFSQGRRPFIGDYISVAAAIARLKDGTQWESNAGAPPPGSLAGDPTFHVAWADNRNVRGLVYYTGCDESVTANNCGNTYEFPRTLESEEDGGTAQMCTITGPRALTRNQNVYHAPVEPGLTLTVGSARKPLVDPADPSTPVPRAFVVSVRNATGTTRTYDLTIQPPPTGVVASFVQSPTDPAYPLAQVTVTIPRKSNAARTVFVTGTSDTTPVIVTAQESGGGSHAVVALNANPLAQRLENQRLENTNVDATPITSDEVYHLDLSDREVETFSADYFANLQNTVLLEGLENEDLLYQRLENENLLYADIENQRLENQRLENQRLENQRLENQRLENQRLENQRLENTAEYAEISWQLQSQTNTTSGYNVQPALLPTTDVEGTQLFIVRSYQLDTVVLDPENPNVCVVKRIVENQVVYNEVDPQLSSDLTNPGLNPNAATVYLEPGDDAIVTLRVFVKPGTTFNSSRAGLAVYAQAKPELDQVCETGETNCDLDFDPDVTPPVLSGVPGDQTFAATNAAGYTYAWDPVTAADAVEGNVAATCTPASPYTFPVGETTVTCSASDSGGNTALQSFIVTVTDTTAPVFAALPDIAKEATGPSGAIVTWAQIYADDAISGQVAATCTPASGTQFVVGDTPVSCSAADTAGNTATAGFTVHVVDTTPPSLTVPADFLVAPTLTTGATVTYQVTATDLVTANPTISCTPASSTVFPGGITTVDCTATDAAGNATSKSFKVTVGYAGIGYFSVPNGKISAGSAVPLEWQYFDANGPVDSANANPVVTVFGPFTAASCPKVSVPPNPIPWPLAQPPDAFASGSSDYRYQNPVTWKFNWKTNGLQPKCYALVIGSETTGQAFVFAITLSK